MKRVFREYTSIENLSERHIKSLQEHGFTDNQYEWVVLEKIHGANFSFLTNGTEILACKRTAIISDNEDFHDSNIILEKYRLDIIELFNLIKENEPAVTHVQVFGEIFGGFYPGYKAIRKAVQKGVYYSPEINFFVFDIRVDTFVPPVWARSYGQKNSFYLSQDEVDSYLDQLIVLSGVPVMTRGKFTDVITIDPLFQTTIPTLFGLEPIDQNIAEGYVLKLNQRCQFGSFRAIVKNKNSKFSEIVTIPKVVASTGLSEEVLQYCTQTRFNNLISKIGINNKVEKFRGIYIVDIVSDYEKEIPPKDLDEFKKTLKSLKKQIYQYLVSESLIEKWLKEYSE